MENTLCRKIIIEDLEDNLMEIGTFLGNWDGPGNWAGPNFQF